MSDSAQTKSSKISFARCAGAAVGCDDDFCLRRGLGASKIDRDDLPKQAPRALEEKARIRWLRAVEQVTSPRDRCIALIPYYAGAGSVK